MPMRPARLRDVAALVDLENVAFATDRLSRTSLRYYVSAPGSALIVCESRGLIVGYCLVGLRKGRRKAHLHSIAVAPQYRGRKLGAALLREAEKTARRRGAEVLRLTVRNRNRRAISLYEAKGYRRLSRIEDFYQDGATALCFAKPLQRHATIAQW
jgi:[ribosomal protein S18]-alanine N-acetyltransferase